MVLAQREKATTATKRKKQAAQRPKMEPMDKERERERERERAGGFVQKRKRSAKENMTTKH